MEKTIDGPLTHERLTDILHYEPQTGVWTWLKSQYQSRPHQGDIAGVIAETTEHKSYRYIGIDQKHYKSQRLAIFYMTGEWPSGEVTQRNHDSLDDTYDNLRVATRSQTIASSKKRVDNTSGFKGVSWNERVGKYESYITLNYKKRHLGWFSSASDAAKKRNEVAQQLQGEFARAA